MEWNKPEEWMFDGEKLEEAYEDIWWRIVMHKYAQAEGEKLLQLNEEVKNDPRYKISAEGQKRIFKSIENYFRRKNFNIFLKKTQKAFAKIAVFFFVFVAVLAIAYTSVEAFRVQVLNLLLTVEKEYTSLRLGNGESNGSMIAGFGDTYAPSYIPEGYRFDSIVKMEDLKVIEYINDEENLISFYECNSSMVINVDTEDAQILKTIKINGSEGIFVLKNEIATVSWAYDNKIFVIIAQINEDEIMQIAKNVIFVK